MSLNLSWVAVDGGDSQTILDGLGLKPVGECSDAALADIACTGDSEGWLLLAGKSLNLAWARPRLPLGRLALVGASHESSTTSFLEGHRDGKTLWSVAYDPEADGLMAQGALPAPFADIRSELESAQALPENEDTAVLFDAPIQLSEVLCGFSPGAMSGFHWTVLQAPPAPRFWGRRRADPPPPPRSIRAAICADILPRARELGWIFDEPLRLNLPGRNHRERDGRRHELTFGYLSGPQTRITLSIEAYTPPPTSGRAHRVTLTSHGDVCDAQVFGRRKRGAPPDDLIDAALEAVRLDLDAAEAVLRGGPASPRLNVWEWG